MKRKIILFTLMSIVMTTFTYFFHLATGDEIWNYGFSYNIAKGAIPYKDFNMIVMPFYSLLMALPLKFFYNNLLVFHLSNAILISLILTIIDDGKSLNSIFICLLTMTLLNAYGYNCFIMILLILVLYLENSKYTYKNEIIGLLLGCILATKQNIGLLLFIPYIINSKKKMKASFFYFLPIILIVIYLIGNNTLLECIDYCFLGLKNFNSNFIIKMPVLVLIELILIILLISKYKKEKDINYLYLLFFQAINYPLVELYHFIIGIIPIFYYLLVKGNIYIKYLLSIFIIFIILLYKIVYQFNLSGINIYKYKNVGNNVDNQVEEIDKFINANSSSRIFIFSNFSYYVKIAMNKKLDKFDLINKGNMGSNEEKYLKDIEKICRTKKCIFIINEEEYEKHGSQLNPIIKKYILENYKYNGKITSKYSFYCNK